jgi:hypothetical protein
VSDDVLGTERRTVPRWVRRSGAGVSFLVVAGWAGSTVLEGRATAALKSCVQTSESDLLDLSRRAAGVESYVSPLLRTPGVASDVRESVARAVEQTVAKDLPRTVADRRRCADITVLPWHDAVAAARAAYLRWLDLRIVDLTDATQDVDALHRSGPDLNAARATAVTALSGQGVTISP